MDPITEFQRYIGPIVLRATAENAELIRFVVIVAVVLGGWLAADGLRTPKQAWDKLFGKGTGSGRGDLPPDNRIDP